MKIPSPCEYQEMVKLLLAPCETEEDRASQERFMHLIMKHADRGVQALALLFACRDALTLPIGQDARSELLRLIDEVTDGYEV